MSHRVFMRRTAAQHGEAEIETHSSVHCPQTVFTKEAGPESLLRSASRKCKHWGREFMLEESAFWSLLGRASGGDI